MGFIKIIDLSYAYPKHTLRLYKKGIDIMIKNRLLPNLPQTLGSRPELLNMQTLRHPFSIRLMHWLTGLIIIAMIASGLVMVRLDDANPWKYESLYIWHQSIGITALVLINIRLFLRLRTRLQSLPTSMNSTSVRVANFMHRAMYVLMLSVPIAGLVMSAAYPQGQGLAFFGWTLPSFLSPNEQVFNFAKTVHWLLAYAFTCLIALHILAALKHRFFDRPENDVLARML
jgi:cytochrome b561